VKELKSELYGRIWRTEIGLGLGVSNHRRKKKQEIEEEVLLGLL
jgi:hypothetical protein